MNILTTKQASALHTAATALAKDFGGFSTDYRCAVSESYTTAAVSADGVVQVTFKATVKVKGVGRREVPTKQELCSLDAFAKAHHIVN